MWELIEEQLAALCLVFSGLADDGTINTAFRRLFGSIESSSARRAAIRNAAEVYFWHDSDGAMLKRLDALLEQVSKASKRRDEIAHGIVTRLTANNNSVGAFLLPSGYNSGRNKIYPARNMAAPLAEAFPFCNLTGEYRYCSSEINVIYNKFRQLYWKALAHTAEAANWRATAASPSAPSAA
jgi:hypothetical protein